MTQRTTNQTIKDRSDDLGKMPWNWQHEQWCLEAQDRTKCYCWPPAQEGSRTR